MTTPSDRQNDSQVALNNLIRYLAIRDHSRLELRQKLSARFTPEAVDTAIRHAEAQGLLTSEEEIADRLVESFRRRMKSPRYIQVQLEKRGLPERQLDEESELLAIRELLRRKFGEGGLPDARQPEIIRFLKFRGFHDRAIKQVLNEERSGS